MGDIVTFTQHRGLDRTWVPKAEEEWWIRWWGRQGVPAARWKDYLRWGRRFTPPPDDDRIRGYEVLRKAWRKRTNYRTWKPPDVGY